jgi:hypothetical protein
MAEAPSQLSIPARALDSLAPERLFDLRWAATVVEQALRRLREECEGKGRLRLFEGLRDYLTAEHADISYATLAVALGVAETVVKKQLHNLRQRYRWLLREEVAHTVENPADVDDEIRHLCAALHYCITALLLRECVRPNRRNGSANQIALRQTDIELPADQGIFLQRVLYHRRVRERKERSGDIPEAKFGTNERSRDRVAPGCERRRNEVASTNSRGIRLLLQREVPLCPIQCFEERTDGL